MNVDQCRSTGSGSTLEAGCDDALNTFTFTLLTYYIGRRSGRLENVVSWLVATGGRSLAAIDLVNFIVTLVVLNISELNFCQIPYQGRVKCAYLPPTPVGTFDIYCIFTMKY